MATEEIKPMHDATIVVLKDISDPIEEEITKEDLDFLNSLDEGDEDETE